MSCRGDPTHLGWPRRLESPSVDVAQMLRPEDVDPTEGLALQHQKVQTSSSQGD